MKEHCSLELPIINSTWSNLTDVGYPEGNLEGNQLLSDSISLSPLRTVYTNDLHVSIDDEPPLGFLPASPTPSVVRHLSGPNIHALTQVKILPGS